MKIYVRENDNKKLYNYGCFYNDKNLNRNDLDFIDKVIKIFFMSSNLYCFKPQSTERTSNEMSRL